jgi:hypothetical protein
MLFIPTVSHKALFDFLASCPFTPLGSAGSGGNLKPPDGARYVGMQDGLGELAAGAVLLARREPGSVSYLAAPLGLAADLGDRRLMPEFSAALRKYAREHGFAHIALETDILAHGSGLAGLGWTAAALKKLGFRRRWIYGPGGLTASSALVARPVRFFFCAVARPFHRRAAGYIKSLLNVGARP